MNIAFAGLISIASLLVTDREDGTLLRAKAIPGGMTGYLTGKVVMVGGMALLGLVLQLLPALLIVDGVRLDAAGWLTLLWLVPLGLLATMPLGAVFGSLFENPRSIGLITLPMFGLVAISGVFYPITSLPGWMQGVAQVFPVYWLGLGHALGLPARRAGGGGARRLVAAPGDVRRAGRVGGGRPGPRAGHPAPDGPPGVRLRGGRAAAAREGR